MNKKSQITIGLALLIIASLFCGSANAQVPVTDTANTKSTIKNWFTNLKESKVVVSTMNTAKRTSAAIGTAKKTVSEYVVENKKKIEEKVAKVKEYKEKAEKYKKDYDKYKAQLDEGIAKAKEMKEKAEEGIQTAKDAAAAAKDMADAAKDKVNDKLGIEDDEDDKIAEENDVAEDQAQTPENEEAASSTDGLNASDSPTASSAVKNVPSISKTTVSRRPFGSAAAVAAGNRAIVSGGTAAIAGNVSASAPVMQISAAPAAEVALERTQVAAEAINEAIEDSPVAAKDLVAEKAVAPLKAVSGETVLQKAEPAELAVRPQVQDTAVSVSEKIPAVRGIEAKADRLSAAEAKIQTPGSAKAVKTLQVPATETLQAVPRQNSDKLKRKSLRRSFTTSSLEGFSQMSSVVPVGFAYAMELPDDCSDVNGTRVFPRTTCMYCNLSSSKAKKEGAIDECLMSINQESAKAQAYSGRDAPKAFRKGKLEIAAAMIAESYRAANKAETFYDNKVAPIAEAPETVEQDALANLVEFNKVIDEQLNDLMQIYSSKLALQAYMKYGKYGFKPEGEEDEE